MERRLIRKRRYRFYFGLGLFILFMFNMPVRFVESIRSTCVHYVGDLSKKGKKEELPQRGTSLEIDSRIDVLLRENNRLALQNSRLREALLSDEVIENHLRVLKELKGDQGEWREFFCRKAKNIQAALEFELKALVAQVVYRSPHSWRGSFWINVGEKDNEKCELPIVRVNSPVLAGAYLVGVVEYVGERRSRVRLLTDPASVVSVRAVRGARRDRELSDLIRVMEAHLALRFKTAKEITQSERELSEALNAMRHSLKLEGVDRYLAKGELSGTSALSWRTRSSLLKGRGFNYDFADDEGEARDLRSGKVVGEMGGGEGMALIQEGDMLVTTGLDGIFPADLPVAMVSRVCPLEEGAAWYDIQARLCAGDLDSLNSVVVLPSLEWDEPEHSS